MYLTCAPNIASAEAYVAALSEWPIIIGITRAMNPNEVRDLEEMNPYDGGDEYRVAMNTEKPGDGTSQEDSDNSNKQGNDNGDTAS